MPSPLRRENLHCEYFSRADCKPDLANWISRVSLGAIRWQTAVSSVVRSLEDPPWLFFSLDFRRTLFGEYYSRVYHIMIPPYDLHEAYDEDFRANG